MWTGVVSPERRGTATVYVDGPNAVALRVPRFCRSLVAELLAVGVVPSVIRTQTSRGDQVNAATTDSLEATRWNTISAPPTVLLALAA